MALSNAERQARFQQRLREKAASGSVGVTAEMIHAAGKALYLRVREQSDEAPDWPGFLASCRRKSGGNDWRKMLPDDVTPDAWDWITDPAERALFEQVAAVVHAVMNPPEA